MAKKKSVPVGSGTRDTAAGPVLPPGVRLFRTLAGLYFAWLYCVRGFGIAVGAHAGYDVLVGLFVKTQI